jgi:hypothetical protein
VGTVTVVGIDPGLAGGIVALDGMTIVGRWPMPTELVDGHRVIDAPELARILIDIGRVEMVVVERLAGLGPGLSKRSAWSLGDSVGTIRATVRVLERPMSTIPPRTWQQTVGVVMPAKATSAQRKAATVDRARALWPGFEWLTKDNGQADAALIGHAWQRGGKQ